MTKEEMEQAKDEEADAAMAMKLQTENGEAWQEIPRTKSSDSPKSTTLEVKWTQAKNLLPKAKWTDQTRARKKSQNHSN